MQNLQGLLVPAVVERLVLVVNHVLSSEQAAMQRLAPHQGRVIALEWMRWPSWLPAAPVLQFRVTPAGLLEWCGLGGALPAALAVQVDASNPALLFARALAGEPPALTIAGDSGLATDIQWLVDNLRWDVEADLERLFGPVVARQLGRLGSALAAALRGLVRRSPWMQPARDDQPRGPHAAA
jgi:ubiquinone biosynthesis accessory factor UbiJ